MIGRDRGGWRLRGLKRGAEKARSWEPGDLRCGLRVTHMLRARESFFSMSDYKKLLVWQKANRLALHAYRISAKIRRSRDVGLRSQIVRSAMSIPANIVEGRRQESERQFARFLKIAFNSGVELEYHLGVAREIEVMTIEDCDELLRDLIEVRRMLHGLLRTIGNPPAKNPRSSIKAPSSRPPASPLPALAAEPPGPHAGQSTGTTLDSRLNRAIE
jgi:four helix bundle protein